MRIVFTAFFLIFLTACAQTTATQGTSFVDPGWGGARFETLVVDSGGDLIEREAIERGAVAALGQADVEARAALDVVSPTREAGQTVRRRAIMNTGAAGVLTIVPKERRIVERYVPSTYYPGSSAWYEHHHMGFEVRRPGFYDRGLLLEEPEVRYEVTLSTLPHYKVVWKGELVTRGPTGMNFNTVGERFARELVKRLRSDGMI